MSTTIINSDWIEGLKSLEFDSIDCCITSPPYWGLRDYGVVGQLGQEPSPEGYINSLMAGFTEVKRVLKPTGTCFVNLGSSYYGSRKGSGGHYEASKKQVTNVGANFAIGKPALKIAKHPYFKPKDLVPVAWMLGIELVKSGWYLRNDVIWQKPNVMPCSALDRFTMEHEYVLFLAKSNKYNFTRVLEPYTAPMNRWAGDKLVAKGESTFDAGTGANTYRDRDMRPNPAGRNKRTVWSINNKPYKGAHFATFPESLVENCLLAGCPEQGTVLDPFAGAGTVGLVAQKYNRNSVLIELNPEYIKLIEQRLS